MIWHPLLITLMFFFLINTGSSSHDECAESSCGSYDPHGVRRIRFPFQLLKGMNDECSSPHGFCLYCNDQNDTMFSLPTISGDQAKFIVRSISYDSQEIVVSDPENCLPQKLLNLYHSPLIHNFRLGSVFEGTANVSFFNCSVLRNLRNRYQDYLEPQDMMSCPIYAATFNESVLKLDLVSCTKILDVVSSADVQFHENELILRWSKPNCRECEAKGKKCKWKNNNSTHGVIQCLDCNNTKQIQCLDCNNTKQIQCLDCNNTKRKHIHIPKSSLFAVSGSIMLWLVLIGLFKIYLYFRKKKEDQIRVERFLEDYKRQNPTRFSFADIKRITHGFKEKLGEGAHGVVFKGNLSNDIPVAVKVLNNVEVEGKEFINEVGILGKIHHINVVRLLGFCAEGIHRGLIYNFFPNGSLQNLISPSVSNDRLIGWEKLQQIADGIAKGIEYLHQGCNHPILHFDINPHNVLLDENFTPKITDFGLAKLCSKNLSVVSMTAARGTLGYIAPEVFSRNFGNVSYKSDIYSYGMLLLEMVGGRKNIDMSSGQTFQILYPEWIHNLLEGEDIHIHIEDEDGDKVVRKLAVVGLWCIQWQPVNRPSIKTVIQMLETGQENLLRVPPNPFDSTFSTTSSDQRNLQRRHLELEMIQE